MWQKLREREKNEMMELQKFLCLSVHTSELRDNFSTDSLHKIVIFFPNFYDTEHLCSIVVKIAKKTLKTEIQKKEENVERVYFIIWPHFHGGKPLSDSV